MKGMLRKKDRTKTRKDEFKGLPQIIIDCLISTYYEDAILEAVRHLAEYRRFLAKVVVTPHEWVRGSLPQHFMFTCWFLKKECEKACDDYCDCTFCYVHDRISRNGKILIIPAHTLPVIAPTITCVQAEK